MKYGLWLGDIDHGITYDDYATYWMEKMRDRGYENLRIKPAPDDAEIDFPIDGEDDADEQIRPELVSTVTTVKCPHCQAVISYPGFEVMFAFVCPECGQGVGLRREFSRPSVRALELSAEKEATHCPGPQRRRP